ncbi:MAG: hypothetical protein KF781_04765 [Chitinophagaceae bacterium]|nr:hypothetical protein [Chitinophagaceae bacterium]MCW5904603.1 hypothetical protein [Chitinophagaceae bacterium]
MKNKQLLSILILVVLCISASCKKMIDKIKEQTVMDAITNGVWYVSKFVEDGTNNTANFNGWEAKYLDDGTFTCSKTGETTATGTWVGNATDWTFKITFTNTPTPPVEKLGGTWTVTRAVSTDKGSYAKTEGGVVYELEMTKKP